MEKRILSLEGLRVLALLLIIISHFEFLGELNNSFGTFYKQYLHNPNLGVDFFFVISGFGMMLSFLKSDNFNTTFLDSLKFALKKIKKLYPLVLITFIPGIIIMIDSYLVDGFNNKEIFLFCSKIIVSPSLMQSLTGMSTFSHALNGVVWFYSCIFIIYIISPYIMVFIRKYAVNNKRIFMCLAFSFILIIVLSYFLSFIDGKWEFDDLVYGAPYTRVFYVIIGMLLACLYNKINIKIYGKNMSITFTIIEMIILVLCLFWFLFRNNFTATVYIKRMIDVPLVSFLIIIMSFEKGLFSRFLSTKFFVKQSILTPYVFLIHYPLRITIVYYISKYHTLSISLAILYVILIISFTIVFSVIYYMIVKYKLQKKKFPSTN